MRESVLPCVILNLLNDIVKNGESSSMSLYYMNSRDENMKNAKYQALDGMNNKRINNMDMVHSEMTEARNEKVKHLKDSNVSIPDEIGVINSKEWVDNGSKL